MTSSLRIVIAQLNFHVGNIRKNLEMHIAAALTARDEHHADLIIFPELSLTGYPPEDLLLRHAFITESDAALHELMQQVQGIHCLVGHPVKQEKYLYNACSMINNGSIVGHYRKFHLPNYGVFDEKRYFTPHDEACVIHIKDVPVGIVICEDIWNAVPMQKTINAGAKLVIVPNASPFVANKHEQRLTILSEQTSKYQTPIVYINQVGGQDELVFDGGSMVMNAAGKMSHFCGFFNETLKTVEFAVRESSVEILPEKITTSAPEQLDRIYQALVTGTRDYIQKNNFPGVLIGISGGIDSALTAAIAVDALGAERVHGVFMPSRYSSQISADDAAALSSLLKFDLQTLSIEEAYQSFSTTLAPALKNKKLDLTEQNIQARCRCILLMALSNATGNLVLTTGNRSEVAVGYCTLYGDMAGGFAVIKNVPKTVVYQLAEYRNKMSAAIPQNTIKRAPTAELAPDQTDQDTLPPYPVLDKILECYLNKGFSITQIVAEGFEESLVTSVITMIHRNEYKRKQYAVGPQIQETSFIKDWRYPITSGFKG
jgi:NAD+ synthase (glutamine-hydrolysing)